MINDETPRIYVACLASYNQGILYGEWIDATQEPQEISLEIQRMLDRSPIPNAEEYRIDAYEYFMGVTINEYESLENISDIAQKLVEYGYSWAAYLSLVVDSFDEASEDDYQDRYMGEYSSEEDFAEVEFNGLFDIPDHLQNYIDYEAFSRDLFISDYVSFEDETGMIHVFRR